MKKNGFIKLHRKTLETLGSVTDREFRYYIMSLGECVWDKRNQLAETFDARTDMVRANMLPRWCAGKVNTVKNSLLKRGYYQKTNDARRLKIADIHKAEPACIKTENVQQVSEAKVQGRELSNQELEERSRLFKIKMGWKPKDTSTES